jgi:outer membrane protein
MANRLIILAALGGTWLHLVAAAPPRLEIAALPQDAEILLTVGGVAVETEALSVEPGEQYPQSKHERALTPAVASPGREPAAPREAEWRLKVDLSVIADSNRTNGTDLETVPIDYGDGPLPVPLDPNQREKAGLGKGASVSAGVRLPIDRASTVMVDAEAYVVDYAGSDNDDLSVLVAAGVGFGRGKSPDGTIQLFAFDRWYGGVEASRGFGLRGNYRHALARGQTLRLSVDARIFESDYGDDFGGKEASLYLAYDRALNPELSASLGAWGHREWLDDSSFSYSEAGIYGGLSHYLSDALTGGVTAGAGRTWFDEPFLRLGPDPRRDWRMYGTLWLMTRRPVGWGITPSLTYTYNRTASSIDYYSTDRHRLRLGVQRRF